jgi:hypothetical protein
VTTAATAAVLGGVTLHVQYELKKSAIPFDTIRQPPDGKPDAKTLAKYDTFQPGDLIRKSFKSDQLGDRQHYAVYIGKDPITGDHMLIDTGDDWKNRDSVPYVRKRGLTWDAGPNDTEYEKVPTEEMYGKEGSRRMSREEIVDRAKKMLYQRFEYKGFDSNCEAFARGIVEGVAYSSQRERVSPLTAFVASFVTDNVLKLRTANDYFPGAKGEREIQIGGNRFTGISDYARDTKKMTAQEMTSFLELERALKIRRETYELIPNPYTGAIDKYGGTIKALPPAKGSAFDLALTGATRKDSGTEQLLRSVGMKSPEEYDKAVDAIAQQFPAISKLIKTQAYRDYLLLFFSLMKVDKAAKTDTYRAEYKRGLATVGRQRW